ncbi:hypothetical protein LEN26_008098 [Aphanomyces euteiches]|nr:hypothetical protein AeMF1_011153 [Aphanomyces euteiches]KAH9130909.1 hypothetical protein LEN26_008098 [Aphanomyces euteiches]KAH9197184.1 hypothetical protein AeNC1_000834 [Aphanomyces euteiches]
MTVPRPRVCIFLWLVLGWSVAVTATARRLGESRRPLVGKIGDLVDMSVTIPAGTPRTERIEASNPETRFMGVQFSQFDLGPGDTLEVSSESNSFIYTGHGPPTHFSDHVHGQVLNIRYMPSTKPHPHPYRGVIISKVLEGFPTSTGREDVCGIKPQWWPNVCNATNHPKEYKNSKSVARLTMEGLRYGTGFLLGCDGYFLTNNHNIKSQAIADSVKIEFGAESSTCVDPCNAVALGCPGSTVVVGAKLIATDESLDYTLLQLSKEHQQTVKPFGYATARKSGAKLQEPIYVVHHPEGFPKSITNSLENGMETVVLSLSVKNECGENQVGYMADTKGGSSGAPVFSRTDHKVIALHHCGGCENVAHAMSVILADLEKNKNFQVPSCFFQAAKAKSSCSQLVNNVDYLGYDTGDVAASDASLCCALCEKQKHCKAFTWTSHQGGTCWLKRKVGQAIRTTGAKSGTVID